MLSFGTISLLLFFFSPTYFYFSVFFSNLLLFPYSILMRPSPKRPLQPFLPLFLHFLLHKVTAPLQLIDSTISLQKKLLDSYLKYLTIYLFILCTFLFCAQLLSLIPRRIFRMLEFIGFSSNKVCSLWFPHIYKYFYIEIFLHIFALKSPFRVLYEWRLGSMLVAFCIVRAYKWECLVGGGRDPFERSGWTMCWQSAGSPRRHCCAILPFARSIHSRLFFNK